MRTRKTYIYRGWWQLDRRVTCLKKVGKTTWEFITKEGEILDTVDLKMFNIMPPCPIGTVIHKPEETPCTE